MPSEKDVELELYWPCGDCGEPADGFYIDGDDQPIGWFCFECAAKRGAPEEDDGGEGRPT